jgi:hypothetical protein
MPDIQVDMFEVQLGAAILLQLKTDRGLVRILADAGIKASGYDRAQVHKRLLPILDASGDRRIDLILGTHYDEDHLNGLVPIIEDESVAIGEAWMPPIANDSAPHALDATLSDADLLPHQFYGEGNEGILADYLSVKRSDCETLLVLEEARPQSDEQSLSTFRTASLNQHRSPEDHERFFRAQLEELVPEGECYHGSDQETEGHPDVDAAVRNIRRLNWSSAPEWFEPAWPSSLDDQLKLARAVRVQRPEAGEAQRLSLSNIRKGAAKDAINAKALHAVMQALNRRSVPVRSEIIDDGTPRRYFWHDRDRRFISGNLKTDGPELKLLGPSRALVRKHWDRLPVEDAARVALSFLSEIKSITPSNQLSYIARIGFAEQGILISGDAGCVDFKSQDGKYYGQLLDAMLPLHVVQIAHHGGNNAHFYRVLNAAGFPEQTDPSLLLLSHATSDKTRPSPEFRDFVLSTLKQGDDIQLLFTSKPTAGKVVDYKDAVHPVVGASNDVGDVQIVYERQRWRVKTHAVEV